MSSASIIIVGNTGKDAEQSTTKNGGPMLKFSVAVSRKDRQSGEDITAWYNCTAFGKDAEFHSGIAKGDKLVVQGRFEPRTYVANDGSTKVSYDVTATAIENCTPRAQRPVEDDIDSLPF